jgi:dTDP-4-amino-4,6-dideoxygalactose transaminase
LVQLKSLPKRLDRLRDINRIYYDLLSDKVDFKDVPMWYIDIYVDDPDKLVNASKEHGFVAKRVHKPIHMQPLYNGQPFLIGTYPNSAEIYSRGVFLPSTTNMTDEEVKGIGESIRKIY